MKFSQELAAAPPFRAREFVAGKDSVTTALDTQTLVGSDVSSSPEIDPHVMVAERKVT